MKTDECKPKLIDEIRIKLDNLNREVHDLGGCVDVVFELIEKTDEIRQLFFDSEKAALRNFCDEFILPGVFKNSKIEIKILRDGFFELAINDEKHTFSFRTGKLEI